MRSSETRTFLTSSKQKKPYFFANCEIPPLPPLPPRKRQNSCTRVTSSSGLRPLNSISYFTRRYPCLRAANELQIAWSVQTSVGWLVFVGIQSRPRVTARALFSVCLFENWQSPERFMCIYLFGDAPAVGVTRKQMCTAIFAKVAPKSVVGLLHCASPRNFCGGVVTR